MFLYEFILTAVFLYVKIEKNTDARRHTMIIIKENGLALYFDVNEKNNLFFYGIKQQNAPEPAIEDAAKVNFTAVEIRTTGANTARHLGGKSIGFLCPEIPEYVSHESVENKIGKQYIFNLKTYLLNIKLNYLFAKGCKTLRTWTEVTNISNSDVGLEYISSFALTGLANVKAQNVDVDCRLMIPYNGWCREFNWSDLSLGELGYHFNQVAATNRIAFSNTGTWSTKDNLPMGCFYTPSKSEALLWQIESNTSWSWEISDLGNHLYLRLSGPSESYSGWWKNLKPGQSFESAMAAISYGKDFDSALAEMTAYRRLIAHRVESDRNHPVIFNDYMQCLKADPTTEKLLPQIDAAAEAGCEIFVIDAGWYADESGWWGTIGAYEESTERFPGGFKKVFDYIREKGMRPGLWVEPEDIGIGSPKVKDFDDDAYFTRHGVRVTERGRHQFDMRNEKVRAHLTAIIDRLVADYGIEYFKFDYNIDAGIGTECNSDSFGDGLYESGLATVAWIDEIQAKHPNLIIENCSSGGMRADYMQLQHYSVQSLTDVWENRFMVQLAAAAPTGVLPEQGCVWCLPRTEFTQAQIASTLVNAMFRRIHLSGKTAFLNDEQKTILYEGIKVYKETRHLVDKLVPFYPLGIPSASSEAKVHCVGFKNENNCFITITNMGEKADTVIPLSFKPEKAEILYPASIPCEISVSDTEIKVTLEQNQGVVIKLK